MSEENEEIVRNFLIITVGSSASIHILGSVAEVYPDLLRNNEIMIIETSKKTFRDAIDYLSRIYHRHYAKSKGKDEKEQKFGFPSSLFKSRLEENSILLGESGGGAVPDRGLGLFEEKREDVLNKIAEIVKGEKTGKELSGIIIIGATGKGTGTLVTPALVEALWRVENIPKPLGFITIPFRFEEDQVMNAAKIVEREYLKRVPLFVIDYERALGCYLYQHPQEREREIPTIKLYGMVTEALKITLKNLLEALNFSIQCSPPLDWSDLLPILQEGKIGTIAFSYRKTRDEFSKYWKDDLQTQLLLRTKSRPKHTRAVIIARGKDIPLGVDKNLIKFHRSFLNAIARRHLLVRGEDYSIVSLIHGFNPEDITPPLRTGTSLIERLLGI